MAVVISAGSQVTRLTATLMMPMLAKDIMIAQRVALRLFAIISWRRLL